MRDGAVPRHFIFLGMTAGTKPAFGSFSAVCLGNERGDRRNENWNEFFHGFVVFVVETSLRFNHHPKSLAQFLVFRRLKHRARALVRLPRINNVLRPFLGLLEPSLDQVKPGQPIPRRRGLWAGLSKYDSASTYFFCVRQIWPRPLSAAAWFGSNSITFRKALSASGTLPELKLAQPKPFQAALLLGSSLTACSYFERASAGRPLCHSCQPSCVSWGALPVPRAPKYKMTGTRRQMYTIAMAMAYQSGLRFLAFIWVA